MQEALLPEAALHAQSVPCVWQQHSSRCIVPATLQDLLAGESRAHMPMATHTGTAAGALADDTQQDSTMLLAGENAQQMQAQPQAQPQHERQGQDACPQAGREQAPSTREASSAHAAASTATATPLLQEAVTGGRSVAPASQKRRREDTDVMRDELQDGPRHNAPLGAAAVAAQDATARSAARCGQAQAHALQHFLGCLCCGLHMGMPALRGGERTHSDVDQHSAREGVAEVQVSSIKGCVPAQVVQALAEAVLRPRAGGEADSWAAVIVRGIAGSFCRWLGPRCGMSSKDVQGLPAQDALVLLRSGGGRLVLLALCDSNSRFRRF